MNIFKNIRILLLILIFIIQSCINKMQDQVLSVNLEDKMDINITDLFNKIELIPLEKTEKSLIAKCTKTIISGNRFHILDSKQSVIFIFNRNGKYVSKIDKKGKGPGEYIILQDFETNTYTKNIEILSANPSKIIMYDSTGNFISEISLQHKELIATRFFKIVDSDKILFYTFNSQNQIYLYSRRDNKIIKSFLNQIPSYISYKTSFNPSRSIFYSNNNEVRYIQVYSNNVYAFEEGDLQLKYTWDFGKYNFDISKDLSKNAEVKYYDNFFRNNTKYAYYFFMNLENNEKIITSLIFNKQTYYIIYNKLKATYRVFSEFKEGLWLPLNSDIYENIIVATIEPRHLKNYLSREILTEHNQAIFDKITMDDNPIVVKYYFKESI